MMHEMIHLYMQCYKAVSWKDLIPYTTQFKTVNLQPVLD